MSEPELVDTIARGFEADAVFERDGVLDRLRTALVEKYANRPKGPFDRRAAPWLALGSPRVDVFNRVISLHARGFSLNEIRTRIAAMGEDVSLAALAGIVAEARGEAQSWRERALDQSYPIIVFERFRLKWRDADRTRAKGCQFAIGFQTRGTKEVLGLWFEPEDDASFWSDVFADLFNRGVKDVLYITSSAGQALEVQAQGVRPAAVLKNPCEAIRQSLDLATAKDRATMQKSLRGIHGAASESDARATLERFAASPLGQKYPAIAPLWRRHWSEIAPLFAIPVEVRRVMTSTHASDAVRRAFQRAGRTSGHVTSNEDAAALMYFAARDLLNAWRRPQREWHAAKTKLAIMFPGRFVP